MTPGETTSRRAPHGATPELETTRLRLRPLEAGDREALFRVYAEPQVSRNLLIQPRSLAEFRRPFHLMIDLASTLGMWVIIHKQDDRLIGRCGFYPCSELPDEPPELAYLLSKDYWGIGLGTEAARRCVDYAFTAHAWPEIVAMARVENTASARVLRKLGMTVAQRLEVRGIATDLYRLPRPAYRSEVL